MTYVIERFVTMLVDFTTIEGLHMLGKDTSLTKMH